jgi:hypothetical protein
MFYCHLERRFSMPTPSIADLDRKIRRLLEEMGRRLVKIGSIPDQLGSEYDQAVMDRFRRMRLVRRARSEKYQRRYRRH